MKLYHITRGFTGGEPYVDNDGVDRWSFSTACALVNYFNDRAGDVVFHPKEVADRDVQWVRRG